MADEEDKKELPSKAKNILEDVEKKANDSRKSFDKSMSDFEDVGKGKDISKTGNIFQRHPKCTVIMSCLAGVGLLGSAYWVDRTNREKRAEHNQKSLQR